MDAVLLIAGDGEALRRPRRARVLMATARDIECCAVAPSSSTR